MDGKGRGEEGWLLRGSDGIMEKFVAKVEEGVFKDIFLSGGDESWGKAVQAHPFVNVAAKLAFR
jgi:hypothetical protein